jgi:hypothetical protein
MHPETKSGQVSAPDASGFVLKAGNMGLETGRRCLLSSRTLLPKRSHFQCLQISKQCFSEGDTHTLSIRESVLAGEEALGTQIECLNFCFKY